MCCGMKGAKRVNSYCKGGMGANSYKPPVRYLGLTLVYFHLLGVNWDDRVTLAHEKLVPGYGSGLESG